MIVFTSLLGQGLWVTALSPTAFSSFSQLAVIIRRLSYLVKTGFFRVFSTRNRRYLLMISLLPPWRKTAWAFEWSHSFMLWTGSLKVLAPFIWRWSLPVLRFALWPLLWDKLCRFWGLLRTHSQFWPLSLQKPSVLSWYMCNPVTGFLWTVFLCLPRCSFTQKHANFFF